MTARLDQVLSGPQRAIDKKGFVAMPSFAISGGSDPAEIHNGVAFLHWRNAVHAVSMPYASMPP